MLTRPVRVNGITRTIVGVLPRNFVGPAGEADFYFPMGIAPLLRNPVSARDGSTGSESSVGSIRASPSTRSGASSVASPLTWRGSTRGTTEASA